VEPVCSSDYFHNSWEQRNTRLSVGSGDYLRVKTKSSDTEGRKNSGAVAGLTGYIGVYFGTLRPRTESGLNPYKR
jgi:hypothetical protein